MLMADRCFNMGSRRKARELALQMLFQWEVGDHTAEHVVSTFLASKKLDADVESFARGLFEGTVKDVEALDHALRERAEHWRPERDFERGIWLRRIHVGRVHVL